MDLSTLFVVKIALVSRLSVLALQLIFNMVPDHKADAFDPGVPNESQGLADDIVCNSLDGLHKWDAKYFVYISRYGYQEENMFAFFPLFPTLLHISSLVLSKLPIPLSTHSLILLSGAILNVIFFIGAAIALYRTTLKIYRNQKFALTSVVAFCFNPSSIFFSSIYTEALYSFCVFQGLQHLENKALLKSTVYFIGSSATRSNGIVNVGFPVYFAVQELIHWTTKLDGRISYNLKKIAWILFRTAFAVIAIILPFVCFNWYGYKKYCVTATGSARHKEWCEANVPILYSYVQSTYWDVGFLRYYKLRKIPNIFLAVPCAFLLSFGIHYYLKINYEQVGNLGFLPRNRAHSINYNMKRILVFAQQNIFVYITHSLFLLIFSLCFMHVEVTTRFIFSSSPVAVWVAASLLLQDLEQLDKPFVFSWLWLKKAWASLSYHSKLLCCYFWMYTVIGTFMHVNYLPWT